MSRREPKTPILSQREIAPASPVPCWVSECDWNLFPMPWNRRKVQQLPSVARKKVYAAQPWFWSDQYDMKLQIAGLSQGYDQLVIRGDYEQGRSFVAWYLKDGKLLAADCVNRGKEFMTAKKLIQSGIEVDASLLADDTIDPKELLLQSA